MATNPYNKYIQQKIVTASKEELTLMLYEGALKFANQAIIAIQNKDYEEANRLNIRVQNIIREFQFTLDRRYEISKDFDVMYEYIHRRLVESNIRKDVEILGEARDLIRDFRDTWKEAMKLAKTQKK